MKFSIFTGEKKSLYIAWASFHNVCLLVQEVKPIQHVTYDYMNQPISSSDSESEVKPIQHVTYDYMNQPISSSDSESGCILTKYG